MLAIFSAATLQELIYPLILLIHHNQEFQNRIEFRVVPSLARRELPAIVVRLPHHCFDGVNDLYIHSFRVRMNFESEGAPLFLGRSDPPRPDGDQRDNPGYCDLLLFRRRKTYWGDRITVDVISAPVVTEDRSRLRDRIVKLFGDGGSLLSMIALSWIETRLAWSYAIAFRKFVFNYWHLSPGHLAAINILMTESYSVSETILRRPLGP